MFALRKYLVRVQPDGGGWFFLARVILRKSTSCLLELDASMWHGPFYNFRCWSWEYKSGFGGNEGAERGTLWRCRPSSPRWQATPSSNSSSWRWIKMCLFSLFKLENHHMNAMAFWSSGHSLHLRFELVLFGGFWFPFFFARQTAVCALSTSQWKRDRLGKHVGKTSRCWIQNWGTKPKRKQTPPKEKKTKTPTRKNKTTKTKKSRTPKPTH